MKVIYDKFSETICFKEQDESDKYYISKVDIENNLLDTLHHLMNKTWINYNILEQLIIVLNDQPYIDKFELKKGIYMIEKKYYFMGATKALKLTGGEDDTGSLFQKTVKKIKFQKEESDEELDNKLSEIVEEKWKNLNG